MLLISIMQVIFIYQICIINWGIMYNRMPIDNIILIKIYPLGSLFDTISGSVKNTFALVELVLK